MRYLPLIILFFTSCMVNLEKVQPIFYDDMEEHGYTRIRVYNRVSYGCSREVHALEWTAMRLGKNYRGRSCCKAGKPYGCSKSYEIQE